MDTVLLVDGDQKNLQALKAAFDKMHQFKVLTAADGKKAIEILNAESIAVLVTDINTPVVDGLELLAHMTHHNPKTPCIVMTTYGKPWYKEKFDQMGFLYYIEKPIEIPALASAIFVALNLKDEGIAGMSMNSFLPLIEMERKTCRLEVKTPENGKGYYYFEEGFLFDAHYQNLSGEQAALEMSEWKKIQIRFSELPKSRSRHRVQTKLMDMAGATWNKSQPAPSDKRQVPPQDNASDNSPAAPYIELLQAIKGYQAMGVFDEQNHALAMDSNDPDLNLEKMASACKGPFEAASKATQQTGLGESNALTLHTSKSTIIMVRGVADDGNESEKSLTIYGVVETGGDWYLMQTQLKIILAKMAAERQLDARIAQYGDLLSAQAASA